MQTVRVDQLANALAEAVRDGMRLEQERIIKLLSDQQRQYGDFIKQRSDRKNIADYHAIERTYQTAIALIKGKK
jgi:hypothetical protein